METIVFIGTQKSGSSREAIKTAARMGFYTVLLTNRMRHLEQREEFEDVHFMKYCDIDNYQELETEIKDLQLKYLDIKAIVSFIDSYCYMACLLATKFGLFNFSKDAVYKMEDKILSRDTLKNTEYIPKYIKINPAATYTEDDINYLLPGVLKSPTSTGSKDVYKVNNLTVFTIKKNITLKKNPNQPLLLEEYIDGPQYLVEALIVNNKVNIVAIIEQEITYINNHFIVTGYYLTQQNDQLIDRLKKTVIDIIEMHGLKNGACHLELRLKNDRWKLIEINPRISGGGMNRLIELGCGINLVGETLKLALKKEVNVDKTYHKIIHMQYITADEAGILEKVTGKKRTLKSQGVLSVYVKPRKGNTIHLPKSMGHRYSYVIATGNTRKTAISNAKNALKELKFHVIKNPQS